jgi:hypothetical protein
MSEVASYVSPPPCFEAAELIEMAHSYGLDRAGRHLLAELVMP